MGDPLSIMTSIVGLPLIVHYLLKEKSSRTLSLLRVSTLLIGFTVY